MAASSYLQHVHGEEGEEVMTAETSGHVGAAGVTVDLWRRLVRATNACERRSESDDSEEKNRREE